MAIKSRALASAKNHTRRQTMNQKRYQDRRVMKYIVNAALICVSCVSMTGCAVVMGDLPTISADWTGCPPQTIVIQDEKMGYFDDTWTAKCEGRTFYCTRKVRGSTVCDESMNNE
jgi:hypothetical protein